jgi:phosphoadenosine phosphosulfate reductase
LNEHTSNQNLNLLVESNSNFILDSDKPKIKKEGWRYEYIQTLPQLQEELAKPFEEKLRRTKQLIKMFAKEDNASIACSFGKDSMVVLYLCLQENPKIKVNFNNTRIELKETMQVKEKVVKDWSLNYYELHPDEGVSFYTVNDRIVTENLVLDDGKKHSNMCCYWLKEKPFTLWARSMKIGKNFTGITAQESRNRMWTACSKGMDYYNYKMGVWKVHPILYWTEEEVWNFTKDMGLPVNEAYAKYNLNRIGCLPCMSYKNWRPTLGRIAPKLYCYICKRYLHHFSIADPSYYEEKEIYA